MFRTLLLSAAVLSATPALAIVDEPTRSIHVDQSGLDLATPAGRAELRQRIASAVEQVCADADADSVLHATSAAVCRRNALHVARIEIDRLGAIAAR